MGDGKVKAGISLTDRRIGQINVLDPNRIGVRQQKSLFTFY